MIAVAIAIFRATISEISYVSGCHEKSADDSEPVNEREVELCCVRVVVR